MPGKQVSNWEMYEKLREKGYSKSSSAKITNSKGKKKPVKKKPVKKQR